MKIPLWDYAQANVIQQEAKTPFMGHAQVLVKIQQHQLLASTILFLVMPVVKQLKMVMKIFLPEVIPEIAIAPVHIILSLAAMQDTIMIKVLIILILEIMQGRLLIIIFIMHQL